MNEELERLYEANDALADQLTEACRQRQEWRGRALKAEATLFKIQSVLLTFNDSKTNLRQSQEQ